MLPTSEDLVAALATEHHLDTHGFDFPAEEIHRGTRADSRDIVCLEVVDDIRDSIQALLHREGVLVVDGTKEVRCFARREQIWRVLQTDRERVQLRPGHDRLCDQYSDTSYTQPE